MICAVITSPRKNGVSYLCETLISMVVSGVDDVVVSAEPGSGLAATARSLPLSIPISVHGNENRLGNHANWMRAANLAMLKSEETKDRVIAICEDDIVFSSKYVSTAESIVRLRDGDDFGFVAAYTSEVYSNRIPFDHEIKTFSTYSMWGACCLVFTRESLTKIVNHEHMKNWTGIAKDLPVGHPDIQHVDTAIGETMLELGLRGWFLRNSLVQHIGEVSSLTESGLTEGRISNCKLKEFHE
jgi:hypothetical protein